MLTSMFHSLSPCVPSAYAGLIALHCSLPIDSRSVSFMEAIPGSAEGAVCRSRKAGRRQHNKVRIHTRTHSRHDTSSATHIHGSEDGALQSDEAHAKPLRPEAKPPPYHSTSNLAHRTASTVTILWLGARSDPRQQVLASSKSVQLYRPG